MAIEAKRGCGYRKVGGLYLVGGAIAIPCDRLPLPVGHCPVCGAGVHFTRSMTEINPRHLFGFHEECRDIFRPCLVCDPSDKPAFLMMVGVKFYPTVQDFMTEASGMGISKRIPFVPKKMVLGETVVYLAHPKACLVKEPAGVMQQAMGILEASQATLIEAETEKPSLGIFSAFIPLRIEKIVRESELTDELRAKLEKQGITPVSVPDGDKDHVGRD